MNARPTPAAEPEPQCVRPRVRPVVVLNGYSRHNTGDWLLFEEAVEIARNRHPGAPVVAVALDPDSFAGKTSADEVLGAPVRPGHLVSGIASALLAIATKGRAGAPAFQALRHAQGAVSVGGGFVQFRSPRELATVGLVHGLQWLMVGRVRLTLTMLPQSIGPFRGRASTALARRLLEVPAKIRVRDQASAHRIAELSPRLSDRVELLPDLVFLKDRAPNGAPSGPIGVVVRNWWFPSADDPDEAEARYLNDIATTIRTLIDRGTKVEMIVHSDGPTERGDDRIATARVIELVGREIPTITVTDAATPEDAAARYATYSLVISVRMHAALLAIRSGTAAIAVGYEAKSEEIFTQLGIPDWVVPIDGFDARQLLGLAAQEFPHTDVSRQWTTLHAKLTTAIEARA